MHIRANEDFEKLKIPEIKEFYPENWSKLSNNQKIAVFQKLSDTICDYEKRPRSEVQIRDFAGEGREEKGGAFTSSNIIQIDANYLSKANSYESFETFIEESVHRYQLHAIQNPGYHKSEEEVKYWTKGLLNLEKDILNQYNYERNEMEVHAKGIAQQFRKELESQHEQQKTQQQNKELIEKEKSLQQAQKREKKIQDPFQDWLDKDETNLNPEREKKPQQKAESQKESSKAKIQGIEKKDKNSDHQRRKKDKDNSLER